MRIHLAAKRLDIEILPHAISIVREPQPVGQVPDLPTAVDETSRSKVFPLLKPLGDSLSLKVCELAFFS
jgi:hypothetical protein